MAKNHYENIPLKIKQEIGNYAAIHGTKTAINHFSKIYLKFPLKRTTLNSWKEKVKKKKGKGFSFIGHRKSKTNSCG